MIQVKVINDAPILVPNAEHKNFTDTGKKIEAGTVLMGKPNVIKGLRRGEPFDYKIFVTDKNEIIYLKNIQNMPMTEVYLGADSGQTPTVVLTPSESNTGMRPILGIVVGALAGYLYAKKQNKNITTWINSPTSRIIIIYEKSWIKNIVGSFYFHIIDLMLITT